MRGSPVPDSLHANHTAHHKRHTTTGTSSVWVHTLRTTPDESFNVEWQQSGLAYDMAKASPTLCSTQFYSKKSVLFHIYCSFPQHFKLDIDTVNTSCPRTTRTDKLLPEPTHLHSAPFYPIPDVIDIHIRDGFFLLEHVQLPLHSCTICVALSSDECLRRLCRQLLPSYAFRA